MTIAYARIAVLTSFIAISIAGAWAVFTYWSNQSIIAAAGRSSLFIVIMASAHLAEYLLYVQQTFPNRVRAAPAPRASFEFSPEYWPALKVAIILQLVFGMLTALMLDGGRSFGFFKVALMGHWIGILIAVGRRPLSPRKTDVFFISWGALLLLFATGMIAPFVWSLIGESHLNGWERLWN